MQGSTRKELKINKPKSTYNQSSTKEIDHSQGRHTHARNKKKHGRQHNTLRIHVCRCQNMAMKEYTVDPCNNKIIATNKYKVSLCNKIPDHGHEKVHGGSMVTKIS